MDRVGTFVDEVHRFVSRRVSNPTDAKDIAQQSLLQACQKFAAFRGGNLRGWLLTIARHLIADHYRAQRRFEFLEAGEAAQTEKELALQSRHDLVPEACANRERLRCYFQCISQHLRLEEQLAVLLADVHGYRDKDAAAELGLRLPTYKLLLHQARARLHGCAGGRCALVTAAGRPVGGDRGPNGQNGHTANARQTGPAIPIQGDRHAGQTHGIGPRNCPGRTPERAGGPPLDDGGRGLANGSNGWSSRANSAHWTSQRDCRAEVCCAGVNCGLGLKCCRVLPRLHALRNRLLEALGCGALLKTVEVAAGPLEGLMGLCRGTEMVMQVMVVL